MQSRLQGQNFTDDIHSVSDCLQYLDEAHRKTLITMFNQTKFENCCKLCLEACNSFIELYKRENSQSLEKDVILSHKTMTATLLTNINNNIEVLQSCNIDEANGERLQLVKKKIEEAYVIAVKENHKRYEEAIDIQKQKQRTEEEKQVQEAMEQLYELKNRLIQSVRTSLQELIDVPVVVDSSKHIQLWLDNANTKSNEIVHKNLHANEIVLEQKRTIVPEAYLQQLHAQFTSDLNKVVKEFQLSCEPQRNLLKRLREEQEKFEEIKKYFESPESQKQENVQGLLNYLYNTGEVSLQQRNKLIQMCHQRMTELCKDAFQPIPSSCQIRKAETAVFASPGLVKKETKHVLTNSLEDIRGKTVTVSCVLEGYPVFEARHSIITAWYYAEQYDKSFLCSTDLENNKKHIRIPEDVADVYFFISEWASNVFLADLRVDRRWVVVGIAKMTGNAISIVLSENTGMYAFQRAQLRNEKNKFKINSMWSVMYQQYQKFALLASWDISRTADFDISKYTFKSTNLASCTAQELIRLDIQQEKICDSISLPSNLNKILPEWANITKTPEIVQITSGKPVNKNVFIAHILFYILEAGCDVSHEVVFKKKCLALSERFHKVQENTAGNIPGEDIHWTES